MSGSGWLMSRNVTQYNCTLAASAATATITATRTDIGTIETITLIAETSPPSCDWSLQCSRLQANPDIAGLGVISAFLFTAYVLFGLLLWCYWYGILPQILIRRADSRIFFANSRNTESHWRNIIEETIQVISDQQLLTGLGVLIAGYMQVVLYDLSVYHWNVVIYLGWISATVHLMSISVLQEKMNANIVMRNIRLCLMFFILALLVVALVPTTSLPWRRIMENEPYYYKNEPASGSEPNVAAPARCFWGTQMHDQSTTTESGHFILATEGIFTFGPLILTYAWKVGQLFGISPKWLRFLGRAKVESCMETLARKLVQRPTKGLMTWLSYKFVTRMYIVYVIFAELLESFMATVLGAIFILSWGTAHLIIPSLSVDDQTRTGEREMGYGQILALLLLLQPVFVMLQMFISTSKKSRGDILYTPVRSGDQVHHSVNCSRTLKDVLGQDELQLLTPHEKTKGGQLDPIIDHLYQSKSFKLELWMTSASVIGFSGVACFLWTYPRIYVLEYITMGWVFFFAAILLCSKRLA